ncbi:MAG: hypothetical protein R2727_01645 [Bacteroidales bacterium]
MFTAYKEKHIHYITMGDTGNKTRLFEIKGIVSLSDTVMEFSDDFRVLLVSETQATPLMSASRTGQPASTTSLQRQMNTKLSGKVKIFCPMSRYWLYTMTILLPPK